MQKHGAKIELTKDVWDMVVALLNAKAARSEKRACADKLKRKKSTKKENVTS